MEEYIVIKGRKKLRNPCLVAADNEGSGYSGPIDSFSFKRPGLNQEANYQRLQESLTPFNLTLSYVWCGTRTGYRIRTIFIVKSQNNDIFWYKYEGPSPGSGQNMLYVHGEKIKLWTWLNWNHETRHDFINSQLSDTI